MKTIKTVPVYLVFAILIIGYYTYSALFGVAFWESSSITRNTGYNNNSHVRGVHVFYHK